MKGTLGDASRELLEVTDDDRDAGDIESTDANPL